MRERSGRADGSLLRARSVLHGAARSGAAAAARGAPRRAGSAGTVTRCPRPSSTSERVSTMGAQQIAPRRSQRRCAASSSPTARWTLMAFRTVGECPIPTPRSGEVSSRSLRRPCNPRDYGAGRASPAPPQPGGDGSRGAAGYRRREWRRRRWRARWWRKRIGFTVPQRARARTASTCRPSFLRSSRFPMPDEVPLEDACSFFVNPFTAYAIVDTARSRGGLGLVARRRRVATARCW